MAKAACLFALFLVGGALGASPVQKVIELLEENKEKVVKDLAEEEKQMKEYAEFCDTESSEKGYAIKTAESKIAELTAEIEDGQAQIQEYADEVAEVGTQMAQKEKELDAAEKVRESKKAAFEKTEAELLTSIDELERAVRTLKGAEFVQIRGAARKQPDVKSAVEALRRIVDASWVNSAARHQIQGLVQEANQDGDDLSLNGVDAPKAAAFESASGGITATMEEMLEKAEQALADARTTEMHDKHNFDMMAQSLTDGIAVSKEKIADAKSASEVASETVGESQSELQETIKNKKSDDAYLKSLILDCTEAKDAWEKRQKDAADEMAALNKAKEILEAKAQVGFVQTKSKGVEEEDSKEAATREKVLGDLKALSKKVDSFALMEMVSAVAADPFEKIKGLIESMIAKLVEEGNQEATQKAFCDEEIAKSKATKDEKNMDIEKLASRLSLAGTKKASLADTVAELQKEIADLDKASGEATKLRTEESTENTKAIKDYKEAAAAVESAMAVLKEYYEGASLVQTAAAAHQPAFGGKKGDAASSILSILEMCGEDFTKMYMEIQQAEAEAAAEYKKMTAEAKVSRASKVQEAKGAESEIKSLTVAITNHQADYDLTSKELDSVLDYLDKLKPQCESKAMSYGDKKARREAEIAGLKEALGTLESA